MSKRIAAIVLVICLLVCGMAFAASKGTKMTVIEVNEDRDVILAANGKKLVYLYLNDGVACPAVDCGNTVSVVGKEDDFLGKKYYEMAYMDLSFEQLKLIKQCNVSDGDLIPIIHVESISKVG